MNTASRSAASRTISMEWMTNIMSKMFAQCAQPRSVMPVTLTLTCIRGMVPAEFFDSDDESDFEGF